MFEEKVRCIDAYMLNFSVTFKIAYVHKHHQQQIWQEPSLATQIQEIWQHTEEQQCAR